jgi:hypothetical protein
MDSLMTITDNPFSEPDTDSGWTGKVQMGHAGRYVLPDPVTGKEKLWTRVSTIAKVLQDSYHLDKWHLRMVAKGMGIRPDLVALAANMDVREDKEALQEVADTAHEAAGGSIGANMGTALHAYCERVDRGEDLSGVGMHDKTRRALDRYQKTMREYGLETDPQLMERVVLNYEYGIVGRLDRILNDSVFWKLPRIGDLKTGSTMDFGGLEIAMQLSLYAHADYIWNEETGKWDEFPPMDQEKGIVMHLPSKGGDCEIYDVDIDGGWKCVRLAMNVRKARKIGKGFMQPRKNDRAWRVRILNAETPADLSAIWREAQDERKWSKSLQKYGTERLAEIKAKETA